MFGERKTKRYFHNLTLHLICYFNCCIFVDANGKETEKREREISRPALTVYIAHKSRRPNVNSNGNWVRIELENTTKCVRIINGENTNYSKRHNPTVRAAACFINSRLVLALKFVWKLKSFAERESFIAVYCDTTWKARDKRTIEMGVALVHELLLSKAVCECLFWRLQINLLFSIMKDFFHTLHGFVCEYVQTFSTKLYPTSAMSSRIMTATSISVMHSYSPSSMGCGSIKLRLHQKYYEKSFMLAKTAVINGALRYTINLNATAA